MKMYSIIWGIICVGIFALLTIYGFMFSKYKDYLDFESKLENIVKESNKDLETEDIIKTHYSKDEIMNMDNELKFQVKDEECNGYVEGYVSLFGNMKYQAYIKCNKYETKGYEEVENDQSESGSE